MKENAIEDPAIVVSAGLQGGLKNTTAVKAYGVAAKDDLATVVAASTGNDFVLDVKTPTWMSPRRIGRITGLAIWRGYG